ncbi:unnamed protein product [Cylindrotheca closterium]|uniref:Uncharacterized protein n=1 Tax=Cylindrotheca closterium TaxID=2856 RepID=A0AAD2FEI6_9STRA|nr:unnamed protein product [Cylindrotheca closterium]
MIRWSKTQQSPNPQDYNFCPPPNTQDDEDENDGFDAISYCSGSVCSRRSSLKPSRWTGNNNNNGSTSSHTRRAMMLAAADDKSARSEVSFDSIGIRQFNMTVGDNPCALGPPVQLDYNDDGSMAETFKIDTFEQKRKPRRSMRELRLSTRQRHNILRKERQLTQKEINEAVLSAQEIRKQRMETHLQSNWEQQWDEFNESAQRKLARYCGWCAVC